MAINTANIKAVITAEDKASGVLKGFGSEVDKTSSSASDSFGKLSTSVVAVTAATAGMVAFGKKSLDAFNQQDLAVARLKAGIENVKSATDKNVDSLIKQAAALQKTTRFSDEQYISAQGVLTTFQLNQKAIEQLTPRLADMSEGLARVTGEMPDLEGNAILVAKAIGGEDVTGLVGALRRVGVLMTDSQQKMLQTGTVEERVALVTQILDQNFQGLAKSAGGTTSGKMTELKNQFNELEESIGSVIATGLTPFLNLLLAHPAVLDTVTVAIGTLTAAYVALRIATAFATLATGEQIGAFALLSGAASTATAAIGSMAAFISGPGLLAAGPFAAALLAIAAAYMAIQSAANGAKTALDNAASAARNASNSNDAVIKNLQELQKNGTPAEKERARITLQKLAATGAFAQGTDFAPGGMALVGERGPELINLPRGSQVIPNNKLGSMGTVNININAGALMGSDTEARKFASLIWKHIQDASSMRNQTMGSY